MLFVLFGFSNGLHTVRFLNRALDSNYLTGTIPVSIGSASALKLLCVWIDSSLCIAYRERAQRRYFLLQARGCALAHADVIARVVCVLPAACT